MKKIKKILAAVSAAVVVSASSMPVSAFFKNPIDEIGTYDYVNGYDVFYGGGGIYSSVYIYSNGMALNEKKNYEQFILTPAEGVTLTPELLGLPEKYSLTFDEDGNARLPVILRNDRDLGDIKELKVIVRKALRKGLVSKADIEYTTTGKCLDEPRLAVKLGDGADIDGFISDYPDYELSKDMTDVPDELKDYDLFSRPGEPDELTDITEEGFYWNIGTDSRRKSGTKKRVSSVMIYGKSCDELHTVSKTGPFLDEFYYVDNPENIAWKTDGALPTAVYKNGRIYTSLHKYLSVSFIPETEQSELSKLTEYTVGKPYWQADEGYSERLSVNAENQEELDDITALVKDWAEKGLVTLPEINRVYTHGCGTVNVRFALNDPDEFTAFADDYPDLDMRASSYDENAFYCYFNDEQYSQIDDILAELQADSRVKEADKEIISCCVIHTLVDDPEPIEYNKNDTSYEVPDPTEASDTATVNKIRGDMNGNGKIDIYDAIRVAQYVLKAPRVSDDEMMLTADYNEDGKVNIYDAIAIARSILRK